MFRLFRTAIAALVAGSVLSGSALAGERLVVLELFTSQGCSSCPPADALLGELAARDDVIALAYHVDYWDYLGWKDAFALPGNAKRQKAYAMAGNRRSIFTPEMIVQGHDSLVGHQGDHILAKIEAHRGVPSQVVITFERQGAALRIALEPIGPLPTTDVELVGYVKARTVQIKRGENAGRELTYHNVVASKQTLGTWSGDVSAEFRAGDLTDMTYVVLIKAEDGGPILGAARVQ